MSAVASILLQEREQGRQRELFLSFAVAILVPDPGIYVHLTIMVDGDVENARTSHHKLRAKRGESRLAPICQIYTGVRAPEVTAVVTACGHPLYGPFLNDLGEEARVDALAVRQVTLLTVNRVVVHEVKVLLQGVVHKSDTVCLVLVVIRDRVRFVFVPLDLVPSDAVHSS